MKLFYKVLFFIVIAFVLVGCGATSGRDDFLAVSGDRNFYMGFTPFPYDYTVPAVLETYQNISSHADIIFHHFDEGIPWTEALIRSNYKQHVLDTLTFRKDNTADYLKRYVAVTPLSRLRDGMALYWGDSDSEPLPAVWAAKTFDDPDVITAYTNHCRYMIEELNPDYFAYGIEVNFLASYGDVKFNQYVTLNKTVYNTLKLEYPDLPIFLTFQMSHFNDSKAAQTLALQKLLPYSDYMAISVYPFSDYADPKNITSNYFDQIISLAPSKPIAIAETAFIAEDIIFEHSSVTISGNTLLQYNYMDYLFKKMNDYDAKFINWFAIRDYDQLWDVIKGYCPVNCV